MASLGPATVIAWAMAWAKPFPAGVGQTSGLPSPKRACPWTAQLGRLAKKGQRSHRCPMLCQRGQWGKVPPPPPGKLLAI